MSAVDFVSVKSTGGLDFSALFDALPALFLVLDPQLKIVAATDAYLAATLTRREEIVGRHLFDVFPDHPDNPSADFIRATRVSIQRVLQSHVADTMLVQRHDVRRPEAEGGGAEVRYWSPVNSPVLNDDGSLAYIIHRIENVTEFVQMKQQGVSGLLAERGRALGRLRRSEERFRATFEQAAVGIAHVAPDGGWLLVNRTLCDIVGYTHDELLALRFQDITHPEDLETDLGLVHQLLSREIPHYSLDKRYLRKEGTPVWVRLTVALVRDEAGLPDYFIVVVENIQAHKEAEAEVLRLNASLECRVEERTAELQAANRELDTFAYAVSHDLRAPLRAMVGFCDALSEDFAQQLPQDAFCFLEQIRRAGLRMGELIDGLLALSRSTRDELQQDDIDLSAMACAILDELVQTDRTRTVAIDVAPGLFVRGDPRMIDVVMRNLLGNAWKYTQRVTRSVIRVSAECREDGEFICVTDNGAGFDMASAGKLFQPFQRLHRQDEFPGTGIGLATVQRIVQRHGGTLDAHGQPGCGARFCFSLTPSRRSL